MQTGPTAARAVVELTVDGSNINDDIVREFDSSADAASPAGERAGENFGDGFDEGSSSRFERVRANLAAGLNDRMGEAGAESGSTFGNRFENALNPENFGPSLFDRNREISGAAGEESGRSFGDRFGETVADRLELSFAGMLDGLSDRIDSLVTRARNAVASDPNGTPGTLGPPSAQVRYLESAYRLNRQFDQRLADARERDRVSISDRVGRSLGAGSRNNFLNLLGSSVGNSIGLVERLTRGAGSLFSTFRTGFSEAESGFLGLGKVGGGFGSVLSQIGASAAASLPALAVGLVIATVAMSALVSVASALLALLVAISATVVSALTGALIVGAGALGAVAVAAGLAVVAFTSLTDAQKGALKADFAPLKQELTGLGQLMLEQIIPYFDTWSSNLQDALYQLTPLASVFGDAIGRAGSILTESLSGPGFAMLATQLGILLPGIVTRLSTALGLFLNGIAGTFSAILPDVSRFAAYLVDVTQRFSDFANSAEGQTKIQDFLNRAISSLISFSGFVREATGFLADLLFSADSQAAGNTIFDSLRDSFAGFREDLKGDDLKNWFKRALEFGGDVKDLIKQISKAIQNLDSDGTLDKVSGGIKGLADAMGTLVKTAQIATGTVEFLFNLLTDPAAAGQTIFGAIGDQIDAVTGKSETLRVSLIKSLGIIGALTGAAVRMNDATAAAAAANPTGPVQGPGISASGQSAIGSMLPSQSSLINSGLDALNQTSVSNGGYKPDPVKKEPKYVNPYVAYANKIINSAPGAAQAMTTALRKMNAAVADAVRGASMASGADAVKSALDSQVDSLRDSGRSAVDSARSGLTSAAETLAGASSKKAAKAALAGVKQSKAELKAAKAQQARINTAAAIVQAQKVLNYANVNALVAGLGSQNATLADYAEARSIIATRLGEANQDLVAKLALRNDYNASVISGIQSFGSIVTAQAKTLNGVQQALTADDIVSNLQDRLNKVRQFQTDLNILLSQGLSNGAYKQLVDAGVETGGSYAAALIQGGQGAVAATNDLTDQINGAAAALGGQASNRLYQAGVDAAQGLVDGLTSLSGQLDSAAARLGDSIAAAVRRSLGIASPSKRLIGDMEYVGDGAVIGLDNQRTKVAAASKRLGDYIAISPSLALAQAQGRVPADGSVPVSGNTGDTYHLAVSGFSDDPVTAARELINEMTGRLG